MFSLNLHRDRSPVLPFEVRVPRRKNVRLRMTAVVKLAVENGLAREDRLSWIGPRAHFPESEPGRPCPPRWLFWYFVGLPALLASMECHSPRLCL